VWWRVFRGVGEEARSSLCNSCLAAEFSKAAPYIFRHVEGHQDELEVGMDHEGRLQIAVAQHVPETPPDFRSQTRQVK